jgi:hypothetical protein
MLEVTGNIGKNLCKATLGYRLFSDGSKISYRNLHKIYFKKYTKEKIQH